MRTRVAAAMSAVVIGCVGVPIVGLVIAGPWLTMAGARFLARRASRPGALIAARRLADDPRAGFRAVSGLILTLFVTTVAVALLTTQDAKQNIQPSGSAATANVMTDPIPGPGPRSLEPGSRRPWASSRPRSRCWPGSRAPRWPETTSVAP